MCRNMLGKRLYLAAASEFARLKLHELLTAETMEYIGLYCRSSSKKTVNTSLDNFYGNLKTLVLISFCIL
jgi:hypothetical protein